MSEEEKRKKRIKLRILGIVILAATAAFMVYSVLVREKIDFLYDLVIAVGIMAFWVVNDIVTPAQTGEFEGRTKEQMSAFKTYALLGGIGYAGLVYFAIALSSNTGFYGALVYLIAVMYKRRYYEKYTGTDEETKEQQEADVSGTAARNTEHVVEELEAQAAENEDAAAAAEREAGPQTAVNGDAVNETDLEDKDRAAGNKSAAAAAEREAGPQTAVNGDTVNETDLEDKDRVAGNKSAAAAADDTDGQAGGAEPAASDEEADASEQDDTASLEDIYRSIGKGSRKS